MPCFFHRIQLRRICFTPLRHSKQTVYQTSSAKDRMRRNSVPKIEANKFNMALILESATRFGPTTRHIMDNIRCDVSMSLGT